MPHFKVSDEANSHPKFMLAGDAATGMWMRAGCFSTHYGMDGFVPEWWVKQQPQGRAKAKQLVTAQLWHPGVYSGGRPEYEGLRGFNFHEWRQDSYEQVEADREKSRKRKQAQRDRESREESRRDIDRDRQCDNGRDSGRTPGYTPYPLPPVVNSGGDLTQVGANDPPPRCPDHPENSEKPCHACRRRRKWDEAQAESAKLGELAERRRARELRENCPRCHGTNTYDDDAGTHKCWPHIDPGEAVHA